MNKLKTKLKPKKQRLSKYEQDIEDNAGQAVPYPADERKKRMQELRDAAREHVLRRQVTIRIISEDIPQLKKIAATEGLPYQTFISSILHKVATGKIKNY
jgi:predicted DNA binding CopG/RHH family protein